MKFGDCEKRNRYQSISPVDSFLSPHNSSRRWLRLRGRRQEINVSSLELNTETKRLKTQEIECCGSIINASTYTPNCVSQTWVFNQKLSRNKEWFMNFLLIFSWFKISFRSNTQQDMMEWKHSLFLSKIPHHGLDLSYCLISQRRVTSPCEKSSILSHSLPTVANPGCHNLSTTWPDWAASLQSGLLS